MPERPYRARPRPRRSASTTQIAVAVCALALGTTVVGCSRHSAERSPASAAVDDRSSAIDDGVPVADQARPQAPDGDQPTGSASRTPVGAPAPAAAPDISATPAQQSATTRSAPVSPTDPAVGTAPGLVDRPTPGVALGAAMPKSAPTRIQIQAIGVDSALMSLGLRADGSLQVPPGAFPAGWYTGAPTPGELGPAIIAGHVDWSGRKGVFYELRRLQPGDRIRVDRADGTTAIFRVSQVQRFAKNSFPTRLVYGNITWSGLRLITCGGAFDHQARSYVDNMVVFADLVGHS